MPTADADAFDPTDARLAAWARALGHPARVAILRALAARGRCVCGEVVDLLPLAQATVSQHLKALREAGLIHAVPDGARTCYCLDTAALAEAQAAFADLFAAVDADAAAV